MNFFMEVMFSHVRKPKKRRCHVFGRWILLLWIPQEMDDIIHVSIVQMGKSGIILSSFGKRGDGIFLPRMVRNGYEFLFGHKKSVQKTCEICWKRWRMKTTRE
jgi:hypothetical protein